MKQLKTSLKLLVLLMAIGFMASGCQDELDNTSKENTATVNQNSPNITTLSLEQVDETFNRLKNDLGIDRYLRPPKSMGLMFRTTTDTLGLTIATDIIKQVTLGDYTSYTMEIVTAKDSTVFYNLTIEYKNGKSGMFVTKYTPTAYWLDNKDSAYQGDIQSRRMNTLEEYTDPEIIFDENLWGDHNHDVGVGIGGGGGSYTPQTSPYYPTDCGGIVIVTMESVPYPCGCGDWPGDNCTGCPNASPQYPGYNQVPFYYCQDYGYGDPTDNPPDDTGGSTGGVSTTDPDPDDGTSIAALIKPEECNEHLAGDLNGDCKLSPYEMCLREGNSQEVCDCVADGGNLIDCQNDCNPNFTCRPGEIIDEDCECRIDLEDPCANKDLINYEVSSAVVSMIELRQQPNTMVQSSLLVDSFILETIDDGWGDVNQDRFSIKINELPNGDTPFQLFNEIRMNFTNLVVGGDIPYFTDVTLEPYSDEDGVTWNSNNPVGAAMDFDTIFDTSTVYCVEYNEDEMYWVFATVTSYDHQGHFVAGVRQFGLEPNGSGGYSFYIRAADRLGGVLDYIANGLSGDDEILFNQAADKTWKNLMENTASFIQNQGGNVDEFDETKTYGARHPYDEDDCQD